MTVKQEVLDQLDVLIKQGLDYDKSFTIRGWGEHASDVPERELRAFSTKAFAAIERIAGTRSQFYKLLQPLDLTSNISDPGYVSGFIPSIIGSLEALRDAVKRGYLETLEERIRTNIHDDFLQQAKQLLGAKYHVAAMVLIGGVLEDRLQKLCNKNTLPWNGKGSIFKYNDALMQGNVYDQANWRRIQSIGDLRNKAAHGKGATLTPDDVEDAFRFAERFVADLPA